MTVLNRLAEYASLSPKFVEELPRLARGFASFRSAAERTVALENGAINGWLDWAASVSYLESPPVQYQERGWLLRLVD